jgi:hypothetical protein
MMLRKLTGRIKGKRSFDVPHVTRFFNRGGPTVGQYNIDFFYFVITDRMAFRTENATSPAPEVGREGSLIGLK